MTHSARRWTMSIARLFAWALLLWAFAGPLVGVAFAQDSMPSGELGEMVVDKPSFWMQVLTNLFDTPALMKILSQPEYAALAFVALNLIVFVETGLLVGFFLPGDSLLVTAGLIASNPDCKWSVPLLLVTLCASAIVGDTVGYLIGYKTGPRIFTREKSFFFNKDHLLKAQQFYETHGGKTIVLARFMPILRTFAPVVAGVGKMEYRQFLFFNVMGGVGWVASMVLLGYFLPTAINPLLQLVFGTEVHVENHVEKVVILVVLVSIAPGVFAWLHTKFAAKPAPHRELVEAK
jgi:membrane-associated protein